MLSAFMTLDPIYIIAQVIGVFAAFFGIFSFQQKGRGAILVWQIINNVLWTVHMFMLGAIAGGILNAIGILRGVIFYCRGSKRWAQSNLWYLFFALLFAATAAYAWTWGGEGALALLPMAGMLFTTFSLAEKDPFRVRLYSIFSSPCWLIYNLINGSIPGVCTEAFLIISIIIGIIRIDLPRMKKKTN